MNKLIKNRLDDRLDKLLTHVGDMSLKRRAKMIIKELELENSDKILDIGCGDGFHLHLLANLGLSLQLTGFDVNRDSLKTARRKLKSKKINLVQGNLMEGLPFKDKSFDKIIMSEVAEHLPNDQEGFTEVYRVLREDGILCLTVPSASYPFLWDPVNWLLQKTMNTHIRSGFWAGIWNQHIRLYRQDQLDKLLAKAGFTVDKMEEVTYWCLLFNHYLVNFAARLFYSNSFNKHVSSDISKFNISIKKRTFVASLVFLIVNLVDRLNDFLPMKNGVSIFAKVKK